MREMAKAVLAFLLMGSAACGGGGDDSDGNGPSPTYNSVAGTYVGAMAGVSQGVAIESDFTLTITQSGGTLGGSFATVGTLTDGIDFVNIAGSGSMSGSIASGNNPSVNMTIRSSSCTNYTARFSGSYDTANRALTISGPVDILNSSCAVVLSYAATLVLRN